MSKSKKRVGKGRKGMKGGKGEGNVFEFRVYGFGFGVMR